MSRPRSAQEYEVDLVVFVSPFRRRNERDVLESEQDFPRHSSVGGRGMSHEPFVESHESARLVAENELDG